MTSLALAASQESSQTYYLRGYYPFGSDRMQISDNSPWVGVKNAPWVNERLVKWGYLPFTHDSQHYYCSIDNGPRSGSHIVERTFICGDPATVQWISDMRGIRQAR